MLCLSQQGRERKTLILVLTFWNVKLKVLKYKWNCRPHATVISKFGLISILDAILKKKLIEALGENIVALKYQLVPAIIIGEN